MLNRVSVRDAEGGETTPSFGHPSNVRRGEGGTAFGGVRSEAAAPRPERPPYIPPNRREGRGTPYLLNKIKN